ncbi:hypothetical protein B6U98_04090 [Thermoplasmatales archaeon ex4572_165]|nr:MAG: hypothetical protein B6U98_04090 [Thermoplasmatales archaeon ex4572_165]RLI54119.1 MAG: hypothetical protein DRP09_13970 [Candidatus Thorarchaeota archaeon]
MNEKLEDQNLIAYCGLNCADCHGYSGIIPDLARDLRKELRQIKYDKFASFISTYPFGKDFEKYEECYKVLGAMVKFRCKRGCRNGGGSPFCKIRKCAEKKELDGCWECDEYKECKKLQFLEPVHGDAHIKNISKIKKMGKTEFLIGKTLWYNKKKE